MIETESRKIGVADNGDEKIHLHICTTDHKMGFYKEQGAVLTPDEARCLATELRDMAEEVSRNQVTEERRGRQEWWCPGCRCPKKVTYEWLAEIRRYRPLCPRCGASLIW